jgi:hypothetical protein
MANNYLQFSVAMDIDPDKLEQLKELNDWNDCIFNNEVEDAETILATAPEFAKKWLEESNYLKVILDFEGHGFITEIYGNEYIVYCEESGYIDSTVTWIYTLIRMEVLRPKEGYVVFTWAETCDKPRPDEFSGGAAMISRYGVDYQQGPCQWAKDAYNQLRRENV